MKRKKQILATIIISLIILTFFVGSAQAQVCTGSYTIDNIDTNDDIALISGCTEITGNLQIYSTSLTDLTGLEGLTSIGGNLIIEGNDALTSLDGLNNIASMDGYLEIYRNTSLTDLTGLEGLTIIGGRLNISGNSSLTSLDGLNNIASMDGYLDINNNDALTSLNGLNNIASVGGDLYIYSNDALTNLCTLYNVNLNGDSLHIYNNTNLSMETVLALETQLRNNGFTGDSNIFNNSGSGLVSCDDDLKDYDLTVWDFSGYYTESLDNMTLSYTLIQDAKGKVTGDGTFVRVIDGDNMTIDVEIKGKVKGEVKVSFKDEVKETKSSVTVKYKVKGKNAEKDKIKNDLDLKLEEDNGTTLRGTEKWKICQKGAGCEKNEERVSLPVPEGMTGEAMLSIDAELDEKGKKLIGEAELILSNDDVYPLVAKGKINENKGTTKYQIKGDNKTTTKGIKFKIMIEEADNKTKTEINGKALGPKIEYRSKQL